MMKMKRLYLKKSVTKIYRNLGRRLELKGVGKFHAFNCDVTIIEFCLTFFSYSRFEGVLQTHFKTFYLIRYFAI